MKSPAGPADMKVIQPRRVEPVKMLWTGGLLLAAIAFALWRRGPLEPDAAQTLRLTGQTMGTTYSVVIPDPPTDPAMRQDLEQTLADTLKRVNTRMSIYNPESEISRFNRHPAHSPFLASDELRTVVAFALRLAQTSGGAYDPTLGPLLRLWGFGPGAVQPAPFPDPEAIESAKRLTGSEAIRIVDKSLIKERPEIELDLNSVAKGFGVDAVARALREKGQNRYLVEVGGEIALAGLNPDGLPWRIGVDRPEPERAPGDRLSRVLRGTDMAIATSGDYRNFRSGPAGTVSHLFDPRMSRPVRREHGSVTVLAPDCMIADGLATTLFVMGPEEGLPWLAREFPDCDALFISIRSDDTLDLRASPRFAERTAGTAASGQAP